MASSRTPNEVLGRPASSSQDGSSAYVVANATTQLRADNRATEPPTTHVSDIVPMKVLRRQRVSRHQKAPKSPKNASSIPSITELRKKLDYGDSRSSDCQTLYNDMKTTFQKYTTTSGIKGSELHHWKTSQEDLGQLAVDFLETSGNGLRYWPDSSSNPNKLQYSKHKSDISESVKQLFFRIIQQGYRNKKYKGTKPNADHSTTPSRISTVGCPESAYLSASAPTSSRGADTADNQTLENEWPVVTYRMVFSREPILSYEKWEPMRKFDELSLKSIKEGLLVGEDAEHIIFTVDGGYLDESRKIGVTATERIRVNDNKGFESFQRFIARTTRNQGWKDGSYLDIDIELVRREGTGSIEVADKTSFTI